LNDYAIPHITTKFTTTESGNSDFPIRQSQSPGMGFCDIPAKGEGLSAVASLVGPWLTWTVRHGLSF